MNAHLVSLSFNTFFFLNFDLKNLGCETTRLSRFLGSTITLKHAGLAFLLRDFKSKEIHQTYHKFANCLIPPKWVNDPWSSSSQGFIWRSLKKAPPLSHSSNRPSFATSAATASTFGEVCSCQKSQGKWEVLTEFYGRTFGLFVFNFLGTLFGRYFGDVCWKN